MGDGGDGPAPGLLGALLDSLGQRRPFVALLLRKKLDELVRADLPGDARAERRSGDGEPLGWALEDLNL